MEEQYSSQMFDDIDDDLDLLFDFEEAGDDTAKCFDIINDKILSNLDEIPLIDNAPRINRDEEYLSFNGNAEWAKQYADNLQTQPLDSFFTSSRNDEITYTSDTGNTGNSTTFVEIENENEEKSCNYDLKAIPSTNDSFIVSNKEAHKTKTYILQGPRESRIKFLVRSPKLWEICLNSGDLVKLKCLMNDILTEDCIQHIITSPPTLGRDKVYESTCLILKYSPDFYVLFSNMKRLKRRVITFNGNSFGTLPFLDSDEKCSTIWNFYGTSLESLDEFHKLQKQKYDLLRSQNKVIKFERKATWYLILNREGNQICKIMTKTVSLEVFEK